MDIEITFTIEEINFILNVLAERPYAEVAPLIEKIKWQGTEDIQRKQEGDEQHGNIKS